MKQYDKQTIHMYSYPNTIYIPSTNFSTPSSPRPLSYFTAFIDTSINFHASVNKEINSTARTIRFTSRLKVFTKT